MVGTRKFWLENLEGRDRSEDLDVDGNNIRMDPGEDVVDWVHLAQDSDQWRAVVNTVMNIFIVSTLTCFIRHIAGFCHGVTRNLSILERLVHTFQNANFCMLSAMN